MRQAKIVNHIFGGKLNDDGTIDRHMQFTERDNIVFTGRIVWIKTKRIRVGDETDIAAAKLAIRSRQMKVPVELLTDGMNKDRIFGRRKFVHALGPQWNREAEQQNRLDQNDRELEVRRYSTPHAGMIGRGMTAFAKADQNENKKKRPTNEERAHKPMGKLENMIDLIAVLGRIRRLTKKLVDQREASHTYPNFLRSALDAVRAASGCGAKY